MAAHDATLSEALTLLRQDFPIVVESILTGKCVLWLGSGISRECFPGLDRLLLILLERLHDNVDPANHTCPYRQALENIKAMTTSHVDMSLSPSAWLAADRNDLIHQLSNRYSDVLDENVRLVGRIVDLCWDILQLDRLYADPAIQPDAEHRFIALLIEERILSNLVTTNWDALIEIADEACCDGRPVGLTTIASEGDMAEPITSPARLLKIHGCARKACLNPAAYRPVMVATRYQITRWTGVYGPAYFKDAIRTLLRQYQASFVGFSGQDWNVQAEFLQASLNNDHYAFDPPKVTFALPTVQQPQREILKAVYGEGNYDPNAVAIDLRAAFRLYAKPLLGSIYVLALIEKITQYLQRGAGDLSPELLLLAENAIPAAEQLVRARYDAVADPNSRWRQLASELPHFVTRFLSIYRDQRVPATVEAYMPVSTSKHSDMRNEPDLPLLGYHWLILAMALIKEGSDRNLWHFVGLATGGGENGQLIITRSGVNVHVFMLSDSRNGLSRLIRNRFVDPNISDGVAIIYPRSNKPLAGATSPRRVLPGIGRQVPHEIWLHDLMDQSPSANDILESLRLEFDIAKGP